MTTIAEIIERRGIEEVLHFTTNKGFVGMLAVESLLARARLPEEKYLEHVYQPNAQYRRDAGWVDYVNLSITRINTEFFGHSSRWHRHEDVWWCVVSVDPIIVTYDGVYFVTTNNTYSGKKRATGPDALEALFSPIVRRWAGNDVHRRPDAPENEPTCEQAEVLYPESISTDYLTAVYVATEAHADIVGTQLEMLLAGSDSGVPVKVPPINVRPDVIEPRTN
jgi:hypothetical protein